MMKMFVSSESDFYSEQCRRIDSVEDVMVEKDINAFVVAAATALRHCI